jgi:two-component system LytT family response regulator
MKLKAIIVDDEELARKNLHLMLEEYCPDIEVIGEASNKNDAKTLIDSTNPDVVFLDIRMPSGAEGFELLESIEKRNFLVVFVTAFKDYAIKAFNSNAIHYLLKPIDADDLELAVAKIVESKKIFAEYPENYSTYFTGIDNVSDQLLRNKMSNKIAISHTKGIKLVDDNTITHLEASGNCTTIYFDDGSRYLDTRTLKVYENMLDPSKFMRIHKSHMINMEKLTEYVNEDGHMAVLKGGKRVPVARNRLSEFLKIIRG